MMGLDNSNLKRIINTNCCIYIQLYLLMMGLDNSNLKRIINTSCCIYTLVPPDDGLGQQ